MDAPLTAIVRKKNVRIGGGEDTVTMKPDKLKTAKSAGKEADLSSTCLTALGASKDVNFMQIPTMKGNKVKKNKMTRGKQHKSVLQGFGKLKTAKSAGKETDLSSTCLTVSGASKDVNLKQKSTMKGNKVKKNKMTQGKQHESVLQGSGKGNKPFGHAMTAEEIEWFFEGHFDALYSWWEKNGVDFNMDQFKPVSWASSSGLSDSELD